MNSTKNEPVNVDARGEVMLLAYHQDQKLGRQRWRPVIYIGPPDEPNNAAEMFVGEWRTSLRKAQVSGLARYFEMYAQRYGYPHPEDPQRKGDGPLPFNVVCWSDNDSYHESRTYDPDAVH